MVVFFKGLFKFTDVMSEYLSKKIEYSYSFSITLWWLKVKDNLNMNSKRILFYIILSSNKNYRKILITLLQSNDKIHSNENCRVLELKYP